MKKEVLDTKHLEIKKLCTASLVVSIIITVLFMIFSVAPLLSAAIGIFVYLMLGIAAALLTICSLGMAWIDEGFRNKWGAAFDFANKLMNDGTIIAKAIGNNIIWISIILFIFCSFGFIVNTISYKKYKDNKAKFIVSIIFISIAAICLIISNLVYFGILKEVK